MEKARYKKSLQSFIDSREKELINLKNCLPDNFYGFDIDCSNLTDDNYVNSIEKQILRNGIDNARPILYYFTIVKGDSALVKRRVEERKALKPKVWLLPKVNDSQNTNLYVGKTNKGFLSRLKQHLGVSNGKTVYAMHLKYWATDMNLKLKIYVANVTLADAIAEKDEGNYVELMESVLHEALKPLLGRSGH